jgi:hypothetical protein
VLSALLVNDTVCLMPGSVATLTGNPQNMIVGMLSGISYGRFAAAPALPALASPAIVAGLLHALFRRDLPGGPLPTATLAAASASCSRSGHRESSETAKCATSRRIQSQRWPPLRGCPPGAQRPK